MMSVTCRLYAAAQMQYEKLLGLSTQKEWILVLNGIEKFDAQHQH